MSETKDGFDAYGCLGKDGMMKTERGRDLCEKALKTINGERQNQYGDPEDSFDLIAHYWTTYLDANLSRAFGMEPDTMESIDLYSHDVAIMMTLLKIARMQGQEHKNDNYVDAIGYIALAGEM